MRCILFFAFLKRSEFDKGISAQSYNKPFRVPIQGDLPTNWIPLAEEINLEWDLKNCMQDSHANNRTTSKDQSSEVYETYHNIEMASKHARKIIKELLLDEGKPMVDFTDLLDDASQT